MARKFNLMMVCMILVFQVSMTVPVFAEEMYVEYNCETQQIENYSTDKWESVQETPAYAGEGNTIYDILPKQIIGECNLIKIENTLVTKIYRATSQIVSNFPNGKKMYGSAIMIGPSTAITAAHCVYNKEMGGFARGIALAPARNLGNRPYGYTHSSKINIPSKYQTNPMQGYDIAVLNLKEAIGKKSGYLGCKSFPTNLLTDQYNCRLEIDGYPGSGYNTGFDNQITKLGEMWGMGGFCTYANGKVMRYDIDSLPGMSGAGIVTSASNFAVSCISGVHNGYSKSNATYNHGTRIDNEYLTWINGLLK